MNLFQIIGALLIFYSLKNYKQAFFLFLAFRLFLNNNINLISIPGMPLLTLETFLSFFFVGLYIFKRKQYRRSSTKEPLPFNRAFIGVMLSYVLSSILSIAGVENVFFALLSVLVSDFICVYLCWALISNKEDILRIVKLLLGAFSLICVYAFIEKYLGYNPIIDYEVILGGERAFDWQYLGEDRGMRIQSFFLHPIGGSLNFGFVFCFCMYAYVYYKSFFSRKLLKIMLAIGIMAVAAALFSNSRTPLVFLALGVLPLLNIGNKRSITILAVGAIGVILLMPYLDFVQELVVSIFDPDKTEVQGSSLEMRQAQFEAAYILMSESPICGLGLKAVLYYPDKILVDKLLGLESIWLWIMVERGIIGIITYCTLLFSLFRLGWRTKGKSLVFFTLAYAAASTVSSTPGMHLYLFYLVFILILKMDRISRQQFIR